MTRSFRHYRAYGLHVHSPIDLPFAPLPGSPSGEADVTVSLGKTPAALPNPITRNRRRKAACTWEAAKDTFLMNVPGVAGYLATGGRYVTVDPECDSDRKIGVFLAGRVLVSLLQQRGLTTFHASAIATETGAILFAGPSGIGKSSLLAALLDRGYLMLSDDVTGVTLDADGRPTVLPAFPCTRLPADTQDTVGWRERAQAWEGIEKSMLPVESFRFHPTPLPLRAFYILTRNDRQDIGIERLPIAHTLTWLLKYTYRKRILYGMGQQRTHFRTLTASKDVPVSLVERPRHPFLLDMLADRIDADLRGERLPAGNDAAAGQAVSRAVAGG